MGTSAYDILTRRGGGREGYQQQVGYFLGNTYTAHTAERTEIVDRCGIQKTHSADRKEERRASAVYLEDAVSA